MNKTENQITVVGYDPKYVEPCRDLMVELEKYLIGIDRDRLDALGEGYREKMLEYDLKQVALYNGKCLLALSGEEVAGMIMGIEREYSEEDRLDYLCPKAGIITELIVSEKHRGKGVGKVLTDSLEAYFKSIGCEYAFVDVFAYNKNAEAFYERGGYHPRMLTEIKKL